MRRVIHTQQSNGKLDKIVYSCDSKKCEYAISITKEHANCQDDKYIAPTFKEAAMAAMEGKQSVADAHVRNRENPDITTEDLMPTSKTASEI
jgi:hypothetical protein